MNRTCPICGTSMEGRAPYAITCDRKCKRKYDRQRPSHTAQVERYKEARKNAGTLGKVMSKQCVKCGNYGVRPDSLHCSLACKCDYANTKEVALYVAPPKQATLPPTEIPGWKKQVFVAGECPECGRYFVGPSKPGQLKFCSGDCSYRHHKRNAKHRRRALVKATRAGYVYRFEVYKRDNFTCKLCSLPIDMSLDRESNDAPSLDHIIPLSKGGMHTMDNLQTAHRLCNIYKSDLLMA